MMKVSDGWARTTRCAAGSSRALDEQIEREAGVRHRRQTATDIGPDEPVGVRLVVCRVTDPDETITVRPLDERRQGVGDRRIRKVDPAHHPRHPWFGCGDAQEGIRLGRLGPCLDRDRPLDSAGVQDRMQIFGTEPSAQRFVSAGHPGIATVVGVDEVLVGVNHGSGSATAARSRVATLVFIWTT